MKIATIIARILLGLVFLAAGLSGFFLINHPPPPPPGLAGQFQDVFFRSRYELFVCSVQLVTGILLLINRYVPLALVALAAVIANILVFHITMQPAGLALPIIVAVLWFIVAWPLRAHFAPLVTQTTSVR
jgi:putative oxidoreductase